MVWCANLVFTINMGQKLIKLFPLEGRGTVGAEPVLLHLIIPATVLCYMLQEVMILHREVFITEWTLSESQIPVHMVLETHLAAGLVVTASFRTFHHLGTCIILLLFHAQISVSLIFIRMFKSMDIPSLRTCRAKVAKCAEPMFNFRIQ